MRRAILIFAVLCGLAGSGTPLPAPAADAPLTKYQREQLRRFKDSAPADHYFGRLKMSFLGVNNTLRFEALRAGDHTIDPSIVNKVNYADDSLQAWAAEYPRDPQLAHSYFLAVLVYQKIWTKPAQERAWAYMQLILAKYPETYFAKRVRNDIAAGFTERYYADPLPCPTPIPTATPSPSPIPSPAPSPTASPRGRGPSHPQAEPAGNVQATPLPLAASTPSPSLAPSLRPSPSPSPSASPAPPGGARRPNVEILTPPCAPLTER
jgi:hypothetical protein